MQALPVFEEGSPVQERFSIMMRISHALTIALILGATRSEAAQSPPTAANPASAVPAFHLLQKYKLGGEGGWDYLLADADSRRAYISRGTHVMVVNMDTGEVAGDIPDTQGVHGIALAADLGRGFTSNGRAGSVTIFDMKTLKTIGQAKTGDNPDAILYDPSSKRVFAFNGRSHDATAIDAATGDVAGTVALGGKPESGVADGKGRIYVNIEDKSEIVEFDAVKLSVLNHWPLAPAEEPTGLAMDRKNRRLFAGCGNQKLAVVNADTGKVIATLPIGRGVDASGFDPDLALAFASNGEGTLTVVHEDSPDAYTVVENVATQRGARTMTIDQKTHHVLLVTADFAPEPAGASAETQRRRPSMVPGSFTLLVFGK
jgi:DNA-binding beta-propeller fold protein YncE